MIDYVEIATVDPQAMRIFFEAKLGYWFKWFGPDYVALRGAGLEVGVHRADMASRSIDGGTLIVFYSRDLEASEALVLSHGDSIIKPTFALQPGAGSSSLSPRAMNSPSGRTSEKPFVCRSSE